MPKLPEITGEQLIRLLTLDGWIEHNKRTHGIAMKKTIDGRTILTIIPYKRNKPIKTPTLGDILSVKQTRLGAKGLQQLIDQHGINS